MQTLSWAEDVLEKCGQLVRSNLHSHDDAPWFGATIDSRIDCSRSLFFALKGEKTDGHRFVGDAAASGSAAVVIDRADVADDVARGEAPFLLVRDALVALQELARVYRSALDVRTVAVTGSAGKTTTKEYIRIILKTKYKVHFNPGNFNNHIGVPLTILGADANIEYLVSEVGANHIGEVGFLGDLLQPDVGVITNVGDAHIGLFGSRDKIAEAKSELLGAIDKNGYAVLPGDDDYIDVLKEHASCRIVTFGSNDGCTFKVSSIESRDGEIAFKVNDDDFKIHSFGDYNVMNAAAAIAVGDICGVETGRMRDTLAEADPISGRSQILELGEVTVVNDSYNANPASMKASLEALMRFPARRRIAILGDMGELGAYSQEAHRDMGEYLAKLGVEKVYWLGELGAHVRAGAQAVDTETGFLFFDATDALADSVGSDLRSGDVVLVKASRACRLDEVVEKLCESLAGEGS